MNALTEGPILALLKLTLVLAVTAGLLRLARQRSARLRHVLATGGLLLAASLPLWERALPGLSVPGLPASKESAQGPMLASTAGAPATSLPRERSTSRAIEPAGSRAMQAEPVPAQGSMDRRPWIVGVWALGVLVLLARRALDLARILRLTAGADSAPALERRATGLARRMGIAVPVRVRTRPDISVPQTWGFRRANVLLPAAATEWPAGRLRIVLVHELEHARRRDYWLHWAVQLAQALYWFHPMFKWLARRSALECELACDEAVLRQGIRPAQYVGVLLDVARAAHRSSRDVASTGSLAAARPDGLTHRVRRILDPRPTHSSERSVILAGLTLLVGVTAAAAPLTTSDELELTSVRGFKPDLLGHLDLGTRQRAVWAMGEREDEEAVDELIATLHDPSPEIRAVAAWALGEIKAPRALPALEPLLSDPDVYVREMSVRAIGEHERPSSVPLLVTALDAPDSAVRAAAVWALGEIASKEAHRSLLALDDPDPGVRAEVLRALERFDGTELPPAAWTGLQDSDPRVRSAACHLLGVRGEQAAVDALLGALRDPAADVRAAAAWALDEINPSRM